MKWIQTANVAQGALIAEDMRDWLPAQHAARLVLATVRSLDLSRFHAAYRADGKGQPPYDPAMMLAVIYYCGLKDVMSSRKLRDACADDVGARLIAGGARPSNKAFAEFKRRHRDAIGELFTQLLALLKAEGVIGDDDEVAAIDGSPVSTAAALSSNMTGAQLDAAITAAGQRLEAELQAWAASTAAGAAQPLWDDDDQDGPGAVPPGSGRKLAAAHRRLARLKAARQRADERAAAADAAARARLARAADKAAAAGARLAALEAGADAKMARYQARIDAGKKWAGKKPVPADRSAKVAAARNSAAAARQRLAATEAACTAAAPVRVSATDPDSRILPAKNGGWIQGFNFQASAGRNQALYATGTHDNPADAGALVPMIAATDANCDRAGIARKPVKTADSGYACQDTFSQLAGGGNGRILVAVRKEAVQAGRRGPAGTRPVPGPWQDMAARLAEPENKKLYKKRGQYVEPFFAQLFQRNGRRIPYRGTSAVNAELGLRGQIHNLAKLFTHQASTGRLIPAPA